MIGSKHLEVLMFLYSQVYLSFISHIYRDSNLLESDKMYISILGRNKLCLVLGFQLALASIGQAQQVLYVFH